jgi:hypothetical protein
MTSNAAPKLTKPNLLNAETAGEESALQWPEPDVPIDDAILKMFKIRVLRLLSDVESNAKQHLSFGSDAGIPTEMCPSSPLCS